MDCILDINVCSTYICFISIIRYYAWFYAADFWIREIDFQRMPELKQKKTKLKKAIRAHKHKPKHIPKIMYGSDSNIVKSTKGEKCILTCMLNVQKYSIFFGVLEWHNIVWKLNLNLVWCFLLCLYIYLYLHNIQSFYVFRKTNFLVIFFY